MKQHVIKSKRKLCFIISLLLLSLNIYAHTWEIRVNQNQDGSLTWYIQSYHFLSETQCVTQANLSGLIINGTQYPIQAVFSGSIVPLSPTVFGVNTSCGTGRNSYGVINTPFLGTTLSVQPYSNVACWANCGINAQGNFIPPPPPVCTSCPITGWSNTVALPGNNNGTPCNPADDYTTATIKVNHLSCASITGSGTFNMVFDPGGANVAYGPFNYTTGIETNVTINIPYGTSNSTQLTVSSAYPCSVTHGLSIPGGQYSGEVITPPSFQNVNVYIQAYTNASNCQASVTYPLSVSGTSPTVTYQFTGATTGSGSGTGSGQVFEKGITHVVVTATNSCGSPSVSFDITVIDNVAPVAVCKPATIYLNASGSATVQASDINNGSNDNCGPVTLSISNTGIICGTAAEGSSLTLTAPAGAVITAINFASYGTPNGSCGNFSIGSCHASNSVSIVSNLALNQNSVTIPATNSQFGDPCYGTVKRLYIQATYSGYGSSNTFNCSQAGNNTVTLKVTDGAGNVSTCNAIVTVVDDIDPTITCSGAVTVQCAAAVPVVNIASVTASDNCSAVVSFVSDVISNQTCANKYTITRTYKAADPSGNFATCTQTITVDDQTAPVISSIPANTTVSCASEVPTADVEAVVATDNCSGTITVTFADVVTPGSCANRFSVARTYTATDVCGNASSQTQTITVDDQTAPVITSIPADVTVSCAADVPAANTTAVVATDNCAGTITFTYADVTTAGSCANRFTIARTYTATDVCGNASSQTQTITVDDQTAPVWETTTGALSVSVECSNTAGIASAQDMAPTATDNCVGTVTYEKTSGTFVPGSCGATGTYINTWVAKDACLNTSTVFTQVITIIDTQAPIWNTAAGALNTSVECSNTAGIAAAQAMAPTATDNCGAVTYVKTSGAFVPGSCGATGTYSNTWVAKDACLNTSTVFTQVITITDLTAPVITLCPSNKTAVVNNAGCAFKQTGTGWNAAATDNCGTPVIKYTLSGATTSATNAFTTLDNVVFNNGVTTVTVKAYDACNNVSTTCTFTVTITTSIAAVSTTPNRQMYFGLSYDQFSTITTTPTGGTAPYTIVYTMNRRLECNINGGSETWTVPSGTSTGTVCPASGPSTLVPVSTSGSISAGGSYAVTVKLMKNAFISATITDAFGCVVTTSTQLWAEDVRCFAGNSNNVKVKICHRNNGNGCVAVCVDESAVATHMAHGDFLGDCTPGCIAPPTYIVVKDPEPIKTAPVVIRTTNPGAANTPASNDFTVQVSPNPTYTNFKVMVDTKSNAKIEIRIFDITGKIITTVNNVSKGMVAIVGDSFIGGTYFAEIKIGEVKKVVKLVKMN